MATLEEIKSRARKAVEASINLLGADCDDILIESQAISFMRSDNLMQVEPKSVKSNGLFLPFMNTKKWTITCGGCSYRWIERVPIQEKCSSVCPCCKDQNVWSLSEFMNEYNRR